MKKTQKLSIGVTGYSGFIGAEIVNHFADSGDIVCLIDSLTCQKKKQYELIFPENPDWILHFGASKSIESSFQDPVNCYRRNLNSTMTALEIAHQYKANFLYMSSYVYGKPEYLPIDEKHPTSALNPYMGSKLVGEQICYHLHQVTGISALILRGFTLYGPTQSGEQLIPTVVNDIKKNRSIIIRDPYPKRDYLYIEDFLRLVDIAIRSDYSGYEVYNVGGGKPYKNIKVAHMANAIAKRPVSIKTLGEKRKYDVNECYADIMKAKRDFFWEPKIDLEEGLRKCLAG